MRKYLSIICLLAIWISGCNQEDALKNQSTSAEGRVFTTSFESDGSRTYLEAGRLSRWTESDLISLFDGNTLNRKYQFDGKTGDNSGTFSIVDKPFGTGAMLTANYAIYPYASDMKISENGVITTTLPAKQNYAVNSFGLGANTMMAVTQNIHDTFLQFKNTNGCLKIQLYGKNVTVKSITLAGNNHEKLAGKANIIAAYKEAPIVFMTQNATESITLDCGEGVKIGNTAESATTFWMVIPPTIFKKGITITIKDINHREFTQSTSKELAINRNTIKPMKAFPLDFTPYLTFMADAAQTLTMSKAVESLQYSIGGNEWKKLDTNIVEFGGANGNLRLRGKSLIGTATSPYSEEYSTISFGNNIPVTCSGDIRSLLDYENVETVNTANARFCYLFADCDNLTTAPALPAVDLATSCYYRMFEGCSNLYTAPALPATTLTSTCYCGMFENCINMIALPELPATTLANSCYSSMFSGCASLVSVPILPATKLAEYCYSSMFKNCTKLVTAPVLPASTLADCCYYRMFEGCSNLYTAPTLPATTLARYCYFSMFQDCTSLVTAPVLPATTLAYCCYEYMFYNCKKLNSITMLATSISAPNFNLWVYNVASSGTFYKSKSLTSYPLGFNGIPSGWTVVSK